MIRNYFKIAWRNLMKNKVFSFINIFGLTIGLTCCMLISLYIQHELRYDTYHVNRERIYQLDALSVNDGKEERQATISAPTGSAMQQEFPEIEDQARLLKLFLDDKTLLQYTVANGDTKSFYETK